MNTKEEIDVYDMEGSFLRIEDRGIFYKKLKQTISDAGKISEKVKTVRLILMNSDGRIYLQKRSALKDENSGLYDKSVGGHVMTGMSYDFTLVKECAEELGFPITVVSEKEFSLIKSIDTSVVGVGKKVDELSEFDSVRIMKNDSQYSQPFMTAMYIGYYDGPIRFSDGESSGIETFTLSELNDDLQRNPNKYTSDLKYMIKAYAEHLVPLR